jgi:hypothetical protein
LRRFGNPPRVRFSGGWYKISYGGYRFPPEIIQQAIWLDGAMTARGTTPAKNNAIKIRVASNARMTSSDWHRPLVAALSVARRRRTRRDASASILTALAGIAVDKSVHGVAFLSWNQHPEPTSSR